MLLQASTLYASASALVIVFVSYRVADFRKGVKLANDYRADIAGDAPLTILLLLLAELNGCPALLVHASGLLFLTGQLLRCRRFLKMLGRYAAESALSRVMNRSVLLLLIAINVALVLGLLT